jgi:OPT family oligopeptide transporter
MHAGERGALSGKLLAGVAALAGLGTFLRDARLAILAFKLPGRLALPFTLAGHPAASWSLSLDLSPVLLGGGALMGFRTAWSMLLGAAIAYGVIAPAMVARGVITTVEYKSIVQLTLWPGAGMLVSSGVLSFVLQGGAIRRAVADLARALPGALARAPAAHDADEAPVSWFAAGFLVLSPVAVSLMVLLFDIPAWAGALAIPLSLLMAVVAARVNGETDISPTKALGPATQLVFGAVLPGNVTANVMSANVTGGVGLHAADLLADIKIGHLLGASARKQVIAQLFGVVVGAAVVVPAFHLLVPSADALGGDRFPAPAVMVWASVSKVLAGGVLALPRAARFAALAGFAAGVVLTLLERWASPSRRRFIPSATGVGIAMVMPGSSSITMFAGALLAAAFRRARAADADRALVPIASGAIVGESLVGVAVALARAAGWSV